MQQGDLRNPRRHAASVLNQRPRQRPVEADKRGFDHSENVRALDFVGGYIQSIRREDTEKGEYAKRFRHLLLRFIEGVDNCRCLKPDHS